VSDQPEQFGFPFAEEDYKSVNSSVLLVLKNAKELLRYASQGRILVPSRTLQDAFRISRQRVHQLYRAGTLTGVLIGRTLFLDREVAIRWAMNKSPKGGGPKKAS